MNILEKLKSIIGELAGGILKNNNFTLFDFSKNETNILEIKDVNKLSIDLSKLPSEKRREIKNQILDPMIQSEEEAFLMGHSSIKTKQIKSNFPENNDQLLLDFYKNKLSPDMYKALEASLIVKSSFKKGEDIIELKKDIANQFPQYGNNICNLVNQGYFDEHFNELYDSMLEDEEFNILAYQNRVEKIVRSLPYTVFITKHKSYDEQSGEVKYKLAKLKRYGTGKLLLHGIGFENVKTAIKIIDEYKDNKDIIIEKNINIKKTIITTKFKF